LFHLWRRTNRAVLIVSENSTASLFDSQFLQRPEIRLLTAYPDDQAMEIARREQPSLIIEDLVSPGHSGLAFCAELASHTATRGIPLILVVPAELWEQAGNTRADVLLGKPLEHREFFDAVRRFLPLPGRRTERLDINLRFIFTTDAQVGQAFSRDLSTKGAFLKTDRILPLGTRLDLRFCIPGVHEMIECQGVVRCTSSTQSTGEPGGIGLEFEHLTDHDRELLESFLNHHGQQRSLLHR
jgi:uncharacterized protein (TIGR02266 family)